MKDLAYRFWAMASGCPVIAMNRSSIPEVAGEAGVLIENEDLHEISAHIQSPIDDYAFIQKQIALGLENVKRFSWDACYRRTKKIYEMALSAPKECTRGLTRIIPAKPMDSVVPKALERFGNG